MANFCSKCGRALSADSAFCNGCGSAINGGYSPNQQAPQYQPAQYQQPPQPQQTVQPQSEEAQPQGILEQFSKMVRTNGIIWVVIACLQYLIALINIILFFIVDSFPFPWPYVLTLLFAIINTTSACLDFKYSKSVLLCPTGIIAEYKPIGNFVSTFVYNLFLGGVIGVTGVLYAFEIRAFVVRNAAQFTRMEQIYEAQEEKRELERQYAASQF